MGYYGPRALKDAKEFMQKVPSTCTKPALPARGNSAHHLPLAVHIVGVGHCGTDGVGKRTCKVCLCGGRLIHKVGA